MPLRPLDSLSILAIVDNEVDPLSPAPPIVSAKGRIHEVGITKGTPLTHLHGDENVKELALEQLCCGAHGLSLMLTGTANGEKQTLLFDTGPTLSIFESNAKRLAPPLQDVDHIHLSHWHSDHSGGMTSAVRMITEAQAAHSTSSPPVVVDLHPNRPDYRGFALPNSSILALEPDPTFEAIEKAGGKVERRDDVHEVLENYFLISGEIPRVTSYEVGMPRALRYQNDSWVSDPLIMDERFVVCHVKGSYHLMPVINSLSISTH
jgi:7,8-dihydropterin-6-yl-methyl-4-(beta-D-ribofuranosyl)aminobenzene 5'-phosphate synthase